MADNARPAIFFDRDNTLIIGADYLGDPTKVELMSDAPACVAGARLLGFAVVTVSNQSGVARGLFTEADVRAVNDRLDELLHQANPQAKIDLHAFCPHHPEAQGEYGTECDCRKPKPGMLISAANELGIDLPNSWLVGDAPRDIEAGRAAGCRTILLTVERIDQSPAAREPSKVEPNFRAATLAEVLDIIRRQSPPPVSPRPDDGMVMSSDRLLADLRRQRETPVDEFNVLRLLAGATQVLALAALVWGIAFGDGGPNLTGLLTAIYLQLLTLTLIGATKWT